MKKFIFLFFCLALAAIACSLILRYCIGLQTSLIIKMIALGAFFIGGSIYLYIRSSESED